MAGETRGYSGVSHSTPQDIYKLAKEGLTPCFYVKGAVRSCPSDAPWTETKSTIREGRKPPTGMNGMQFGT